MKLFKSLFEKNKKSDIKTDQSRPKTYSQEELNKSLQCSGMDFLLMQKNLKNISDMKEVCYTESYACISAIVNNRPSAIYICTMMYPADFNEHIASSTQKISEIVKRIFDSDTTDIYAVGVGLINKNNVDEEYHIGTKYSVAIGKFYLISVAKDARYGLTINSPVQLSTVNEEYFYLEHLETNIGKIIDAFRYGSIESPETTHILDEWEVSIRAENDFPEIFAIPIYMDAYALDIMTIKPENIKKPPLFFKWSET